MLEGEEVVSLFYHHSFLARVLHESSDTFCNKPEYIIADIALAAMSKLLVGVVYPPKTGHLDEFETAFLNLVGNYHHVIVLGDFNANLLSNSFDSNYLRNIFQRMGFTIVPSNATHHISSSHSWLDVYAVDLFDKIITSGQTDVPFWSGHDLIYIEYVLKVTNMTR